MDGLGAMALGAEPALKEYMNEKPKSRTQSIVSKKMFTQILCAGAWVALMSFIFLKAPIFTRLFGNNQDVLLTGYFSFFVLTAVFNGFNVRSEGLNILENMNENKGFLKVMSAIVIVQVILTFVGGDFFSCTPLNLNQWIVVVIMALTIIPFDMLRKIIFNPKEKVAVQNSEITA